MNCRSVFDMRTIPSFYATIRSRRELDALITYCCSWKIPFRYDPFNHVLACYLVVEDDKKALKDISSTFDTN